MGLPPEKQLYLLAWLAMANEKPSRDPLRDFEAAFETIAKALVTAAEQRSFGPAEIVAESFGLREQGDGRPSATYIYERSEGDLCLWLRTHWYDQSHPFSIQPDMNKLRLELRQGSVVLRSAESSYED
jgi:hypothetical protein